MGTIKSNSFLKTSHFSHVNKRFLPEFLLKMMSFLVYVYTFMLKIIGFISKYANRSNSNFGANLVSENSEGFLSSGVAENKSLNLQKNRDFDENIGETEYSVFLQSKYQFMFGENLSGYVEDAETVQFVVQEMFEGSNDVFVTDQSCDSDISGKIEFLEQKLGDNIQEFDEKSEIRHRKESLELEFEEKLHEFDENLEISQGKDSLEQDFEEKTQEFSERSEISQRKDSLEQDFEEKTQEFHENPEISHRKGLLEQDFEEYIHEFHEELETSHGKDSLEIHESDEKSYFSSFSFNLFNSDNLLKTLQTEEIHQVKETIFSKNPEDTISPENETMDDQEFSYEVEFSPETSENQKPENSDDDDDEYIELKPEIVQDNQISRDFDFDSDSDSDEEFEADVLLEHQRLVQQMKMELKSCRIGGLPTISEDCESPKMSEDLKPLKIDHKFEYKDMIEEIQKFYKCYLEKMRKLDILNYQTLHAISFLQLKESEVFTSGKKRIATGNFVLPKMWSWKVQRIYADPTHKSIVEMHTDLESVYVGQLCLSWEILSWLHVKARELIDYDRNGTHSYNRVTEEFQQFQVLVQRFMEDEPFQGHRIQNYVKNRCLIRSLLHVPTIKDDRFKGTKGRSEETDAITLEMLIEIIWESMLVFRDFLWADKRSTNVATKGIPGTKVDNLQDPTNIDLFFELVTDLQKKERRIRENTRSENCIVKKLKKHHRECRPDHEHVTSQVELRLVSRVLAMSRLTKDQLLWCQTKLSHISFVRRKVHLESSFLLFPC